MITGIDIEASICVEEFGSLAGQAGDKMDGCSLISKPSRKLSAKRFSCFKSKNRYLIGRNLLQPLHQLPKASLGMRKSERILTLHSHVPVDILKQRGVKSIHFCCLIASPEGVKALTTAHPDVAVHTTCIDERLNEIGYILPGLGDAGDRAFNTV